MTPIKPSITKAFDETIFTEMKKNGFVKLSTKSFARIKDRDVLQWVILHAQTGLRREYLIEFGIQLICKPSESHEMTIGGRFTKLSSAGTYGAKTEKMLEKSIERALIAYLEEVRPKMSTSDTLDKLIEKYSNLSETSPTIFNTGHPSFSIACAYASLDQIEKALSYCKQAKELYSKQQTNWAKEYHAKVASLESALKNNDAAHLLSNWRSVTINSLKLKKCIT